ncbi:hypothetical protein BJ742DRAFT_61709 [Cladochytrium replicatum]|nr:hypothetical protein BJ742DRAFT_61709 [Cladochytrium replicatum]
MDSNPVPLAAAAAARRLRRHPSLSAHARAAVAPASLHWRQFKSFVVQARILETGVATIVANSFKAAIVSFVNDVVAPPIAELLRAYKVRQYGFIVIRPGPNMKKGYKPKTAEEALASGAVIVNHGKFIHQLVNFLVVGYSVYWFFRAFRAFFNWKLAIDDIRHCPACLMDISTKAVRCPHCTSYVAPLDPPDLLASIAQQRQTDPQM